MAIRVWNGTNGSWSIASNWYPGSVPIAGDTADIVGGVVDANGVDLSHRTIYINAVRGDITTGLTVENTSLGTGSYVALMGTGNVAVLTLNNAETDGYVVAQSGPSEVYVHATDINRGWWGIASTTGSSMTTVVDGRFLNYGAIEAGAHGSYTLSFNQNQQNDGIYQVDSGGTMSFISGNHTPATYNWFYNYSRINVNGGNLWMGANVQQSGKATITITNNGTLTLTGETDGGVIQIDSGMLTFAPTQFAPGPLGASELHASIGFTGQSGEINLGEAIKSAAYDAGANDIKVIAPWKGGLAYAADFHLIGSYTASEFTFDLSKGLIDFHHTTS